MRVLELQASLDGSAFIIAAYDQNRVVGMARLIWDGGSVALIHDIFVLPEYQMQGIEAELIAHIYDRFKIDSWVFEWLISDYFDDDNWFFEDGVLV